MCVLACLAAASCGTPAPSAVDSGGDGGVALPPPPSRLSRLPSLAGLASRASDFKSGPCSSSACIGRWKAGFIAALFVEGVVGSAAPRALRLLSPVARSRSLHLANAFSGGIFFSTGMLHILPEAIAHLAGEGHGSGEEEEHHDEDEHEGEEEEGEHEDEHDEHGHESGHGFPTGYALAVVGYYAILFLEHLVLRRYSHSHGNAAAATRAAAAAKGQSLEGEDDPAMRGGAAPAGEAVLPMTAKGADADPTTVVEDPTEAESGSRNGNGALVRNSSTTSARSVGSVATDATDESATIGRLLRAENTGFFSPNFGRAALAALSVAIHVVFESLSLGLGSSWAAVFNTFLAIAAHKWATAASLGVKFEKERLRWVQSLALIVVWSAVTPATAGIGAAIDGGVGDDVTGVLLALSAGAFLYIGAFEVTAEEFVQHTRDRWAKAAAMTVGAVSIMLVTLILSRTGVH